MKILIEGENEENYLAKCHEAFRTGLRRTFDARAFGKGYDNYKEGLSTYQEIIDHVFDGETPDIIIPSCQVAPNISDRLSYKGLNEIDCHKAVLLGDYWNVTDTEEHIKEFLEYLEHQSINTIISYFPQPLEILKPFLRNVSVIYLPPCFDPCIFNNWNIEKEYDVGFLAAGTTEYTDFYPERFIIHNALKEVKNINYLWASHPGWQQHTSTHPFVGKEFSKRINSCKIFITTGGIHKNLHAKYIEAIASGTVLVAEKAIGMEDLGFIDGINYVSMNKENFLIQINNILSNSHKLNEISKSSYELAIQRHSCYVRAIEFHTSISQLF